MFIRLDGLSQRSRLSESLQRRFACQHGATGVEPVGPIGPAVDREVTPLPNKRLDIRQPSIRAVLTSLTPLWERSPKTTARWLVVSLPGKPWLMPPLRRCFAIACAFWRRAGPLAPIAEHVAYFFGRAMAAEVSVSFPL
jgi:hypothetical protein